MIRDAIASADRLLLVIGPQAVQSDYVRDEWEQALNECRVITPVLRLGDYALIPPELSKLDCVDMRKGRPYDEALGELLRVLQAPIEPLGELSGVPSLPPHFMPRPDIMGALTQTIFADINKPTVITSARQTAALQGMGGIGKSVMAAGFARACETRRTMADGVIWVTIGQTPDLLVGLRQAGVSLGDAPQNYLDVSAAQAQLTRVLADKVCLIVLDDVWDVIPAQVFKNALGTRCRLLVTTRDGSLATGLGAQEHQLDVLPDEAALKLLADWSEKRPDELPAEAHAVSHECGNLPFALALAGAMARDGTPWSDLLADCVRPISLFSSSGSPTIRIPMYSIH